MKSYPFILLLLVAGAVAVRAEIPADWSTNYAAAVSVVGTNQQPALVFFTASWCGPCKLMVRTTLSDPLVKQTISSMQHVAIDIDEHPELAAKHHVNAVPTFILLSAGENEVVRHTGLQPTGEFLRWLTNSTTEAGAVQVQQVAAQKDLADVDQWLASPATNALQLAAAKLFDLCDVRDPAVVQAAVIRLKTIADRDPAALLNGLNDARLATRIQVANVLRYKIGDGFEFDPWSDAASRSTKILACREKLASRP